VLDSTIVHNTVPLYAIVTVPLGVPPVPRILGFTRTWKTTACSLPKCVTCPAMESLVNDGQVL